jgi:hypothetical protein
MKHHLHTYTVAALMLATAGCGQQGNAYMSQANDANWELIGTGYDKALALNLMGTPDAIQQITVLGIETERLIWRPLFPPRRYQLDLVMGKVAVKHREKQTFLDYQ